MTLNFKIRHHLKFCQACELAVVGVPEDDEVLPLLPHALEPVHLPHPVVGDPLEDQQAGELVPGQGHLGSASSSCCGGGETAVWRAVFKEESYVT